jgi:hypothetical protein
MEYNCRATQVRHEVITSDVHEIVIAMRRKNGYEIQAIIEQIGLQLVMMAAGDAGGKENIDVEVEG